MTNIALLNNGPLIFSRWFSARRPRSIHDPERIAEVFYLTKPTHTLCPFVSCFPGLEAVNGFSLGATLSASFGFWSGASPAVRKADGLAFHSRRFTSLPTSLRHCLTLVASYMAASYDISKVV